MGISSHPVDIPYPVGRKGFRPLADLDPRLKLKNGKVTCATCHRATEQGRVELSLPVRRSRLCLACHSK